MNYSNKNTYQIFQGVAIATGLVFTMAPFAYALSVSTETNKVEVGDDVQVTSGAGSVSAGQKVESDSENDTIHVDGVRVEGGVNTAGNVRIESSVANDHATGTLRAEGEASDQGLKGIENAEFHINLSGGEEGAGTKEVEDANQVRTPDDFQSFVQVTAKKDAHVKSVDVKDGKVDVEYEEPAKLFGFIATTLNAHVSADANGNVAVSYPWYHIFMKKTHSSASLQSEVARAIAGERKGVAAGIATSTIQATIATTLGIPNIFEIIANTLKNVSAESTTSTNVAVQ